MEHCQNRRNLQYSMPSRRSQFDPNKNLQLISFDFIHQLFKWNLDFGNDGSQKSS